MRLRYLYLPDLPPMREVRMEFGRGVPLLIDRACAIRFVIGINGTGKSRLLQALADIFLNLEAPRLPGFPFALAYDLGQEVTARTLYIRHLDGSPTRALLVEFAGLVAEDTNWAVLDTLHWDENQEVWSGSLPSVRYWDMEKTTWEYRDAGNKIRRNKPYRGDNLPSMKGGYIPNVLLAYTSGDQGGWETLFRDAGVTSEFDATALPERPRGWSRAAEKADRSQRRNAEIAHAVRQRAFESAERLLQDDQIDEMLKQDQPETTESTLGWLVTPAKLKLALCAVTLHRAVQDFRQMHDAASEAAFLEKIDEQVESGTAPDELRRILNTVDWLWPVSISLRVDMHPERLSRARRDILLRLYRYQEATSPASETVAGDPVYRPCVTAVIRDPEGGNGRLLVYDLRRSLPNYPDNDTSTANALIVAIAEGRDASAFEIFSQLSRWHDDGLLEDEFLTVRKRHTDDLLLYDWLSDGERMFLGRMALFQMLRGMGDALVLLDEPETHFNDIWKREIVALIEETLKDEPSDVVISTHSSITLSDVANDEIERLRRVDGHTVADHVDDIRTFGADPSELMIAAFEAKTSIGRYSREELDKLLQRDWQPENLLELEHIIRQIGPGYHRSELRLIWSELRAAQS